MALENQTMSHAAERGIVPSRLEGEKHVQVGGVGVWGNSGKGRREGRQLRRAQQACKMESRQAVLVEEVRARQEGGRGGVCVCGVRGGKKWGQAEVLGRTIQ